MIPEEIKHRIGVSQSLSSVEIKQLEREELERLTNEFLDKGKKIYRAMPNESAEAKRFFNNQGPINPAKKRKKDWAAGGLRGK